MNVVNLVGRLGRDPELRQTTSGKATATLSVATDRRVKRGEQWEKVADWHQVVVWDRQAENVAKFLSKGSELAVSGRLQTRKWQDKDGKDRYSTEVVAHSVEFIGGRSGAGEQRQQSGGYSGGRTQQQSGYGSQSGGDADIPF